MRNTIGRLDKERNKQMEEATNIQSQNTTLIIQKTTLEDKLRNGSKITQKHQGEVEELRNKVVQDRELHATQMVEMRQKFQHDKDNIKKDFKDKLEAFYQLRTEQYEEDKETWMHVFRSEVETKIRELSETNQCLSHKIKVFGEKNEECQSIITSLNHEITKITKVRDRAILARQELKAKLNEVRETTQNRIQELETRSRRYRREHEKMKQMLVSKDNKLIQLEKKYVDYFQEINAFKQLLATADDSGHMTHVTPTKVCIRSENSVDRITKKRRFSRDAVSSPSETQYLKEFNTAIASKENRGSLGFSIVDLKNGYLVLENRSGTNSICMKG